MKAIRIHAGGGVENLRLENRPAPAAPDVGDAIVKLEAASVNRTDVLSRQGRFPLIPGSDGAGTVVDAGPMAAVKVGDRVCIYPLTGCGACTSCARDREILCRKARILGDSEDGTYAEYVRVSGRNCFRIPEGLSFEEAAVLPTVYPAVWRMLIGLAELKPGETVLILGAGGGVATAALQIARQSGCETIVASRSGQKLARARALGAAHTIDTEASDAAAKARQITGKRGVDLIVDTVGGEGWVRRLAALAKGGRLVMCGALAGRASRTDLRRVFWNHLKLFGCRWGSRDDFHTVLRFFDTTRSRPVIDRVFPLRDVAAAQRQLESGKHFGRIVLRIHG